MLLLRSHRKSCSILAPLTANYQSIYSLEYHKSSTKLKKNLKPNKSQEKLSNILSLDTDWLSEESQTPKKEFPSKKQYSSRIGTHTMKATRPVNLLQNTKLTEIPLTELEESLSPEDESNRFSVKENLRNLKSNRPFFVTYSALMHILKACSGRSSHPDDVGVTIDTVKKDLRFQILMKQFVNSASELPVSKLLAFTKYFHYMKDPQVCPPQAFNHLLHSMRKFVRDFDLKNCIHLTATLTSLVEEFPSAKLLMEDICRLMERQLKSGQFERESKIYLPALSLFVSSQFWSMKNKEETILGIKKRLQQRPLPLEMSVRYFKMLLDGMKSSGMSDPQVVQRATVRLVRTFEKDKDCREAQSVVDLLGALVGHVLELDDRLIHYVHHIITIDLFELYFLKLFENTALQEENVTKFDRLKLLSQAGLNLTYLGFDPMRITDCLTDELATLKKLSQSVEECQLLESALSQMTVLKPDKMEGFDDLCGITDEQSALLIHTPWRMYFNIAKGNRYSVDSEMVQDYIQGRDQIVTSVVENLEDTLKKSGKFDISKFSEIDGVVYDVVMEVVSSNSGLNGYKVGILVKTCLEEYIPNPFTAVTSHLSQLSQEKENFHFSIFEFNKWNSFFNKPGERNTFLWKFLNGVLQEVMSRKSDTDCIQDSDFVD